MRLYAWVIIFGSMVFGIGWFARGQSLRAVAEPSQADAPRDMRRMGPHISNVKRFATEIGMSEQQIQELENLVSDTTDEVRRREQDMAEYLRATKERVDSILTMEQLDRLKELNDQRWREWRMASLDQSIAWLEQNATTDENTRTQVRTVLTAYYDQQSTLMRGRGRHSPEAKKQYRELIAERDSKLAEVLSAEDLERFVGERLSRRRGGWDRGRGDRRSEGGRRGDGRRGRRGPRPDRKESVTDNVETKQLEPNAREEKDN